MDFLNILRSKRAQTKSPSVFQQMTALGDADRKLHNILKDHPEFAKHITNKKEQVSCIEYLAGINDDFGNQLIQYQMLMGIPIAIPVSHTPEAPSVTKKKIKDAIDILSRRYGK